MISPPAADSADPRQDYIRLRGVRTHNLKNIDLDIPRGKLVVITGPSGAGKSSLAFDTLYAEGQRQFIEGLSVRARQFFDQLERPDVDSITGLAPVICIDQRPGRPNYRATLATTTEIHDCLRLLFARVGDVFCHQCGAPIRRHTPQQIGDQILQSPPGTKLILLAPIIRATPAEAIDEIRKAGLVRVRLAGKIHDLDQLPPLENLSPVSIAAVIDRIIVRPGCEARLAESMLLAIQRGGGLVITSSQPPGGGTEWNDAVFNTLHDCPRCSSTIDELEPRSFSFNSPYGACPTCGGLGSQIEFDAELVIPDWRQSPRAGGLAPWTEDTMPPVVAAFLTENGGGLNELLETLSQAAKKSLLLGNDQFPGVIPLLESEYAAAKGARKEFLETFRGAVACYACGGARLKPAALAVRVGGKNVNEICQLSVRAAAEFFQRWQPVKEQAVIAGPIVQEVVSRLSFLIKVGADYLTLSRATDSLSGGEFQRVRLATGIGSGLTGILYILDEPSIGLHPRDNARLIAALRELQSQQNSVVVVEHDEAIMRAADWLIDIGPAAGARGGQVMAAGKPQEWIEHPQSLTGKYLAGELRAQAESRRRTGDRRRLVLTGASANNLKQVTAEFPIGLLIGVSGVSGSGKSSLIQETLAPAVIRQLGGAAAKPGPFTALMGVQHFQQAIVIDQGALGRASRGSPATYTGIFDEVRQVYAATKEARQLGFKASRFSFNTAGGRCEECRGLGQKRIEMNFLPDFFVTCPACQGKRFNPQTLRVKFKGLDLAELLALSVEQAAELFHGFERIFRPLQALLDVGLGYLPLGQSSAALSGGEAQRIKLATELARRESGDTLYILDEPTTGLHFDDIRLLLSVFQRLVDRGNTIIVVEHQLDVLKSCDWLIDLGPEGGDRGGDIICAGPPEAIAACPHSATGAFLRTQPIDA